MRYIYVHTYMCKYPQDAELEMVLLAFVFRFQVAFSAGPKLVCSLLGRGAGESQHQYGGKRMWTILFQRQRPKSQQHTRYNTLVSHYLSKTRCKGRSGVSPPPPLFSLLPSIYAVSLVRLLMLTTRAGKHPLRTRRSLRFLVRVSLSGSQLCALDARNGPSFESP